MVRFYMKALPRKLSSYLNTKNWRKLAHILKIKVEKFIFLLQQTFCLIFSFIYNNFLQKKITIVNSVFCPKFTHRSFQQWIHSSFSAFLLFIAIFFLLLFAVRHFCYGKCDNSKNVKTIFIRVLDRVLFMLATQPFSQLARHLTAQAVHTE